MQFLCRSDHIPYKYLEDLEPVTHSNIFFNGEHFLPLMHSKYKVFFIIIIFQIKNFPDSAIFQSHNFFLIKCKKF